MEMNYKTLYFRDPAAAGHFASQIFYAFCKDFTLKKLFFHLTNCRISN